MPKVDQRKLDKPFQCKVCYLRFKSRTSLADHSSEHQAPSRCTKCGGRLRSQFDHYSRCP